MLACFRAVEEDIGMHHVLWDDDGWNAAANDDARRPPSRGKASELARSKIRTNKGCSMVVGDRQDVLIVVVVKL